MTVYFHGSFGLNRNRMSGILQIALGDSDLRDQEIAERFGFNAPFTARYRSWLHKTGMDLSEVSDTAHRDGKNRIRK